MTSERDQRFSGTMPVQERLRFDAARLADFIRTEVADFPGELQVEEFVGGQSNPTYKVGAGDATYVLRRKPPGKLLKSAHAVDREFRVITALQDTPVPVARTFALCEDESIIGTVFYLMEYLDGRVIWNPQIDDASPRERSEIYDALNDSIAKLHSVDFKAVGLEGFGKEGEYIQRQIHRWSRQYVDSQTQAVEAMDKLMEWLPAQVPDRDESAIVHGDYRLDNNMLHRTENHVIGILDWELSTIGHPLADFNYTCLQWRLPADSGGFDGLDLDALGLPQVEDFVASYCQRTGRNAIEHWDFYTAYNLFRLAAISQGIMGRVRDGTAASKYAEEAGRRAVSLAKMGWQVVRESFF